MRPEQPVQQQQGVGGNAGDAGCGGAVGKGPSQPQPASRLLDLKRAGSLGYQLRCVSDKKWPPIADDLVECPAGCRYQLGHQSGECARTCASCDGPPINGKPAVQCPTCGLFFCDVDCTRRMQCPHDGSLCSTWLPQSAEAAWAELEAQDDNAAAGLGCQCMCCRNRWPPACEACECAPCICADDGFACNGEASWKTRYARWISDHCVVCA